MAEKEKINLLLQWNWWFWFKNSNSKYVEAVEYNNTQAISFIPANIYLFQVNNRNTKKGMRYVQSLQKNIKTKSLTRFWCPYC